jgi:hypothetical protein
VIPEGRACKLYLDVEWTRKGGVNDWIDDASVMQTLVQRLCKFMSNVYFGVLCFPESILHLDSSTPDKFSRHLILNATSQADDAEHRMNVLFANNVHAGAFMSDFVANEAISAGLTIGQVIDRDALHKLHLEQEASRLFCFNAEGALTFCVDTGIYNKNRCFRLPLSSKCGKTAVLVPHCSNKMPLDGSDSCLLKSSLVCPCEADLLAASVRQLTHLKALKSEDICGGFVISSAKLSQSQRSVKCTKRAEMHSSANISETSVDDCILEDWAVKTGLSGQCSSIKVPAGCMKLLSAGLFSLCFSGLACAGRLPRLVRSYKGKQVLRTSR